MSWFYRFIRRFARQTPNLNQLESMAGIPDGVALLHPHSGLRKKVSRDKLGRLTDCRFGADPDDR